MEIGTLSIWIALVLSATALACSFLHYFTKEKYFKGMMIAAVILCIVVVTFSYVLLTYYFLTSNFDIHYVWAHSGENLEWHLKLSGVWAGQEGSLLLWVWIILLSLGIEEIIQFIRGLGNKEKDNTQNGDVQTGLFSVYDLTRTIVVAVVFLFLLLLVVKDPFDLTKNHPIELTRLDGSIIKVDPREYSPGGAGMNPMLRNLWMVIHPPILFVGYALVTIPFAAVLGYSITGDKKGIAISLQWSRIAWLFLTLGIGIGALWAYVALGWGGYWAWDPVEVASLIPWIALTAFLHVQLMNKRKGQYTILAPFFGMVAFVLVIFATFITRSGFWESIHAWQETEIGALLAIFMISILLVTTLIFIRSFIKQKKFFEFLDLITESEDGEKKTRWTWDDFTLWGTTFLFFFLTTLTVIGLFSTMGKPIPQWYETRLIPFTFLLLLVMVVCLAWRSTQRWILLVVIGGVLLASIACALFLSSIFPGEPRRMYFDLVSTSHIMGFLIPIAIISGLASIYAIFKKAKTKSILGIIKGISPHIIHIGVILMIVSYGPSQWMITEKEGVIGVGDTIKAGNYEIELMEYYIEYDTGDPASNEQWDTWHISIKVFQDGSLVTEGELNIVLAYRYLQDGRKDYYMMLSSDVFITRGIVDDLFIHFYPNSDNDIIITVKIIPMMSVLWGGMVLCIIGILARTVPDVIQNMMKQERYVQPPRERERRHRKREVQKGRKKKTDIRKKDYDSIFEEELRRRR
jgi:cytochrome c-type biogenesis protein CcmF